MVLKPDVVDAAIQKLPRASQKHGSFTSPRAVRHSPSRIYAHSSPNHCILLAGRYESIDERVIVAHAPEEISLGDFVPMGGDVPALAIIEGCAAAAAGSGGGRLLARRRKFWFIARLCLSARIPH